MPRKDFERNSRDVIVIQCRWHLPEGSGGSHGNLQNSLSVHKSRTRHFPKAGIEAGVTEVDTHQASDSFDNSHCLRPLTYRTNEDTWNYATIDTYSCGD
jgi:hypothetical protein